MQSAIHAKRKIDAIISIRQDNKARSLTVTGMNEAAERLTGYSVAELTGKKFNLILPPRIRDIVEGYLEYEGENDFAAVARRIPNFQIVSKNQKVVPTSMKVFNLVEGAADAHDYELLMRDLTLINKLAELKELILNSANTIQEKDQDTGLPSINSVVFAVDTSYSFLEQHSAIEVCFGLVEVTNIDYYRENYGEYVANELIGTLGSIVKKCLRVEDVIGYMGNDVIGVVLIDCNLENAKTAIQRTKAQIGTAKITMQNGKAASLSVGIAYTNIRKDMPMAQMIERCEAGLNSILNHGGEGVVQV